MFVLNKTWQSNIISYDNYVFVIKIGYNNKEIQIVLNSKMCVLYIYTHFRNDLNLFIVIAYFNI